VTNPLVTTGFVFVFVGPTSTVTIAIGQRITPAESMSVGSTTAANANVELCCQSPGGGTVFSPWTASKLVTLVAGQRMLLSPVTSIPGLAAGRYRVGNCVRGHGHGNIPLNLNDWSSGWAMVTN